MIFMNCMFGYLCLLIVMKWATGSTADLYHTLIYMFLSVSGGRGAAVVCDCDFTSTTPSSTCSRRRALRSVW